MGAAGPRASPSWHVDQEAGARMGTLPARHPEPGAGCHHPMSMIGNLRRATDAEVARLLANPEEIRTFLYREPGRYEHRADIDLDKAWHGTTSC